MINSVRNTVLSILNKNNYGYISPADFNLFAKQAQLDIFEDYFYQYNNQINKENNRLSRLSGTGYADIKKGLEEVIDSFSVTSFLSRVNANVYALPTDYYLINKIFYYPFILLGGDRHCKSKVFCTRTQYIDWNPDLLTLSPAQARLQMQTS